jgi:hypothetical protein
VSDAKSRGGSNLFELADSAATVQQTSPFLPLSRLIIHSLALEASKLAVRRVPPAGHDVALRPRTRPVRQDYQHICRHERRSRHVVHQRYTQYVAKQLIRIPIMQFTHLPQKLSKPTSLKRSTPIDRFPSSLPSAAACIHTRMHCYSATSRASRCAGSKDP